MTTAAEATAPEQVAPPQETAPPAVGRKWQPWALALIVLGSAVLYAWNIGSTGWGNTFYTAAVKSMSEGVTNFVFGSFDPAGVVTVDKPPMGLWTQVLSVWIFGWHSWAVLLPQVIEGSAAVFLLHRTVRRWAGENVALVAALILAITPVTVAINRDNNPDTMLTLICVASAYAFTRSVAAGISARSATMWLLQAAFWVGCGFITKSLAAWMIVPALGLGYLFGRNASWGRRFADLLLAAGMMLVSSFWWVVLTAVWPGNKPYVGGSTDGSELTLIFGYNGLGRVFGEGMGRGGPAAGGGGAPGGGGAGAGGAGRFPGGGAGGAAGRFPGGGGAGGAGGAGAAGHAGGGGGGFAGFSGDNGIGRMFGSQVGGQVSWLIPLCLFVLAVVAVLGVLKWRKKLPADHQLRAGWVLWGSWLIILSLVFSFQQGIFHPYYTTQLAPAVAALAAAGLVLLWRHYRDSTGFSWLLLPIGIAVTAVWAWVLVARDPSWNGWLRYAVAAVALVAIVGLVLAKLTAKQAGNGARAAAVLGLVAVLLAPGVWSAATAFAGSEGGGGAMASAGPPGGGFGGGGGRGGRGGGPGGAAAGGITLPDGTKISQTEVDTLMKRFGGGRGNGTLTAEQQGILNYVTKNAGNARIKLAVEGGSMGSSTYIIDSDVTVIGMGGFMGSDPAPSVSQLTQWKQQGSIGFVLTSAPGTSNARRGGSSVVEERTKWVQQNCKVVPASAYGGSSAAQDPATGGFGGFGGGGNTLYNCVAK